MKSHLRHLVHLSRWIPAATTAALLGACGGGGGAAVEARPQSIRFDTVYTVALPGTTTVSATASSGLAVTYSSRTPAICTIDSRTGVVTSITAGECIIVAHQSGNTTYAPATQVALNIPVIFDPNQTISFAAAPALTLFSTATVSASATSGLAVSYSSTTPGVCGVDGTSGLVSALSVGNCIIAADQAGDANYNPAPQATLNIPVTAPPGVTVPGAPTGVTATLGNSADTVVVSIGATASGGAPITGYTAVSHPAGITATAATAPITVTCPSTCAGYAFSVTATNAVGDSAASAPADVVTDFDVITTFYEPDTQPRDTLFIGTFTLNSTTGVVSDLHGILSESMTGDLIAYPNDNMTWLSLGHQLSSIYDATLGGRLVAVFLNSSSNTLSTMGGGDGWTPGTGFGLYYNFPDANPGNAYARIFVDTVDPFATMTQARIDKLAYADCAPGGMMGATCMTGTTVAGYGTLGTMSGYPISQVITKQP